MPVKQPAPGDLEPIETRQPRRAAGAAAAAPAARRCSTPTTTCRTTAQAFDAAGVHPEDCRTLADLAKFPFTTKDDLRDNYPFGMFAVPREQVRAHPRSSRAPPASRRWWATRRTTSTPGPTWWRARSAPPAAAPATWCTWPTATACSPAAWARTTAPSGWAARWCRCRGGQTEKQVQLIHDFRPDIIMVTPSYMQVIVEEFERQGLDPRAMSRQRRHLRRRALDRGDARATSSSAGIDAVDIYGLSEVMGPGVANECIETKDGPVIWEDHFYPEIIDPETGELLPDGERGRAGVHHADQGGAADHPLPHARPDAPAAAAPRAPCAAWARSPAAATTC